MTRYILNVHYNVCLWILRSTFGLPKVCLTMNGESFLDLNKTHLNKLF